MHLTAEQYIDSCRGISKKRLMRRLQAEFHKRGWGRLYKRLSIKRRHLMFDRMGVISMLYLLQFNEGDIVHDYSSNHRIVKIPPPEKKTAQRWWGRGVGFFRNEIDQFKYENDWLSCGCGWHPDPARTREKIEGDILSAANEKGYFAEDERYVKWAGVIRSGGHVVDENGILTKELQ